MVADRQAVEDADRDAGSGCGVRWPVGLVAGRTLFQDETHDDLPAVRGRAGSGPLAWAKLAGRGDGRCAANAPRGLDDPYQAGDVVLPCTGGRE
ncbi:UNVERIFIED_CONTAM: hypothetical protein NCL1_02950 [Trichonephila clavipes]